MNKQQHLIAFWENGSLILATRQVARTLEGAKAYANVAHEGKECVFIASPFEITDDLHPYEAPIEINDWHYVRPR